jgi:hypothetical protein
MVRVESMDTLGGVAALERRAAELMEEWEVGDWSAAQGLAALEALQPATERAVAAVVDVASAVRDAE